MATINIRNQSLQTPVNRPQRKALSSLKNTLDTSKISKLKNATETNKIGKSEVNAKGSKSKGFKSKDSSAKAKSAKSNIVDEQLKCAQNQCDNQQHEASNKPASEELDEIENMIPTTKKDFDYFNEPFAHDLFLLDDDTCLNMEVEHIGGLM